MSFILNAYEYESGKPQNEYNVEQQARIVEHWYVGGMKQNSPADDKQPGCFSI